MERCCRELTPQSLQNDGATPLFISAWQGHGEVVAQLLAGGAEVDKAMVRVCGCEAVAGWLSLCVSLSLCAKC